MVVSSPKISQVALPGSGSIGAHIVPLPENVKSILQVQDPTHVVPSSAKISQVALPGSWVIKPHIVPFPVNANIHWRAESCSE